MYNYVKEYQLKKLALFPKIFEFNLINLMFQVEYQNFI